MRLRSYFIQACVLALCVSSWAQTDYDNYPDYEDYAGDYGEQDNLYYDYAQREQMKNRGVAGGNEGGGGGGGGVGTFKLVATGVGSYMLGATIHARRSEKDAKRRHHLEQKKLYAQYYDDVYKLSEQNRILQSKVEDLTDLVRSTEAKAELEALQRDYDEFKQPDIDGDDRISRGEFNMYVKNYLSNYPGLSEKDYPKFDDFDHDGDGFVSFQEYSQQMALQAQQAELEELYSGSAGDKQKAQALNDMYKSSRSGELYY